MNNYMVYLLSEKYEDSPGTFIFAIILVVIMILLSLVAISADVFLIYVICRFKRLKHRINMYILNCCILHILYVLSKPISIILWYMEYEACYPLMQVNTFLALYVVLATALGLDWFISSRTPTSMQKYYKYIFAVLYLAFLIEGAIPVMIFCSSSQAKTRFDIFNILCLICLLVVLILNCLPKHYNSQNNSLETSYALTVSNIITFSMVPLLVFHLVTYFYFLSEVGYAAGALLFFTEFIPVTILMMHPILFVYLLGRRNKYFKMAFTRSLSKYIKSYAGENIDDELDAENGFGNHPVTGNYSPERQHEPKLMPQATDNGQTNGSANVKTVNDETD